MRTPSYAILKTDDCGTVTWIEAVPDVEAAKARILHLAERFPAEYAIIHRPTSVTIANFRFKHNQLCSVPLVSTQLTRNVAGT